jgi:UDP-glucuronate 4-epimerase
MPVAPVSLSVTIYDQPPTRQPTPPRTYLITGAAGFIGMHASLRLLARGDKVVGVDNLNDYYDVTLKDARLAHLTSHPNFAFHKLDVADRQGIADLFAHVKPQRVIHLAAQAGVRYSLTNPQAYIDSNVLGFTNILEGCRRNGNEHLVYASSSSVYGGNTKLPFSEHDNVDHPVSLYAASKKANELMAHAYSHLFRLPTTGLRFFTVYGPWGRPDMALFLFTRAILERKPIDVFNHGKMVRDFTYIDDIVEGVIRVIDKPAEPNPKFDPTNPDPASSNAPYRLFNIGNNQPTSLMEYISALETALGQTAEKNYLPMQPGDVPATSANTDELGAWVGLKPNTAVQLGIARFVDWYRNYYKV